MTDQPDAQKHHVELEFELNHIPIREIVYPWADALELDRAAIQVQKRGVERDLIAGTLRGYVRFTVVDVQFVAYFDLNATTEVWIEPAGRNRSKVGPICTWDDLERGAAAVEAGQETLTAAG